MLFTFEFRSDKDHVAIYYLYLTCYLYENIVILVESHVNI